MRALLIKQHNLFYIFSLHFISPRPTHERLANTRLSVKPCGDWSLQKLTAVFHAVIALAPNVPLMLRDYMRQTHCASVSERSSRRSSTH